MNYHQQQNEDLHNAVEMRRARRKALERRLRELVLTDPDLTRGVLAARLGLPKGTLNNMLTRLGITVRNGRSV